LRVGLVKEGFGLANMDERVAAKVREAADRLASLGAQVEEISVPEHALGGAIWQPIGCEGLVAQMMHGNGMGFNWKGQYDVGLIDAHSAWRQRADDLSATLKICMFVGQYGIDHYRGRYYAKAQNIGRRLKASYDSALGNFDLLLMPTLPIVAQPLPDATASLADYIGRAFEMIGNTAPFDITGHPAMSLPCGLVDGLPVGAMLIGKAFDEGTLYQAAAAYEAAVDWRAA
jgi:amidase